MILLPTPSRGDVWLMDFNPTRGHEQSGIHPALVVSVNLFNQGPAGLIVVLPITSKQKQVVLHVEVLPPEAGLPQPSYIKCEDMRSLSKDRLIQRYGVVSTQTLTAVEDKLRILLKL